MSTLDIIYGAHQNGKLFQELAVESAVHLKHCPQGRVGIDRILINASGGHGVKAIGDADYFTVDMNFAALRSRRISGLIFPFMVLEYRKIGIVVNNIRILDQIHTPSGMFADQFNLKGIQPRSFVQYSIGYFGLPDIM